MNYDNIALCRELCYSEIARRTSFFDKVGGAVMTEREKMLAGQLYDCGDPELLTQWHKAKNLMRDYNRLDSENSEEKDRILTELLGGRGQNLWWQQLRSEYELHLFG